MTLQRLLLTKLRLHPSAMAGRAFPPHACWWPSRSVWMVDCRSQDDLPITPAPRREMVSDTVYSSSRFIATNYFAKESLPLF